MKAQMWKYWSGLPEAINCWINCADKLQDLQSRRYGGKVVAKLKRLSSGDSLLGKLSRSTAWFQASAQWSHSCGNTEVACQNRFADGLTDEIHYMIYRVGAMEAKLWQNWIGIPVEIQCWINWADPLQDLQSWRYGGKVMEKLKRLSGGDSLLDKLSRSTTGFTELALRRQSCGKTEVVFRWRFTAE